MGDPFRMADFDYFRVDYADGPLDTFRFEFGPSGAIISRETTS
jgi:hypothetical protein